ncbi:hypothetical protein [Enterobacter sp.]|uniref:hypothetical protein n=1 Tax=Enterobacter sp. TaxID=42895 RepID=UPI00298190D3|nr:hypothetical protein [Enterobacter sp.]
MTDITELTAKLKAAALDEIMCREACDTSDAWHDAASPENVLALTEALEAAEELNKHLDLAVRKAEVVSEKLRVRAEAFEATMIAAKDRAQAAQSRIAELEARTLAVKLPPYSFFDFKLGSHHASGAYVNLEAMNKELAKAGIKLQIEGE